MDTPAIKPQYKSFSIYISDYHCPKKDGSVECRNTIHAYVRTCSLYGANFGTIMLPMKSKVAALDIL